MEIKQSLKAKANEGNEQLKLQLKSARQAGQEETAAAAICVGGGWEKRRNWERGLGSGKCVLCRPGSWQLATT